MTEQSYKSDAMKNVTGKISASVLVLLLSANSALAQSGGSSWWHSWQAWFVSWWGGWSQPGGSTAPSSRVPEIDASTGMLALAAVGAAILLAWEVNRRRNRG